MMLRDGLLLFPLFGVVLLDQSTKQFIKSTFELYEAWPSDGFFRILYTTNTGIAFGLFPGQTMILAVMAVIAICFLLYFYRSHAFAYPVLRLAIGLELGGALGNLIDRFRSGAVVDFIDIGPWPTFNVADSAIVIGIVIICVKVLLTGAGNTEKVDVREGS